MAQPKGYAAFILFPHLKTIPPDLSCEINRRSVLLYACLMRSDGR
ncbi:MAG: hypothetical protein OJF52_002146 [Nitrospira sp.]|jgi:hypothetical protein|nr:MAG: hypothetical protein OJF52_002146 [Nitrospira sp.]